MTAGQWRFSVLCLFLFATALPALPTPDTVTPTYDENATLATELRPPPLPEGTPEGERHFAIFVINLYGVKNATGETDDEMFENEIIEHAPGVVEPLATVLLVVEQDENNSTTDDVVDLEEFAKDLEMEGYTVDRIKQDGDTKVIRVSLEDPDQSQDVEDMLETSSKNKTEKQKKNRTKRTVCLKCKRGGMMGRGGGGCGGGCGMMMCGGGGGGCGGGQSNGYGSPGVTQQKPQMQMPMQMPMPMHMPMHQSGGGCNSCGGGGYGGGGGWSSSHAQASAQAQSSSWGGK